MSYVLIALQIVACGFICVNAVLHLNRMTRTTAHAIRAAYICLAVAGVSGIASCFLRWDIFECLFAVGIALFLFANRRTLDVKPGPTA